MDVSFLLGLLICYPFVAAVLLWFRKEEMFPAEVFCMTEFLLMLLVFVLKVGQAGEGVLCELTYEGVCGFGLHFQLDGFRLVYGLVASFMWMMAALLSPQYFAGHHNTERFYTFLLLTLGATMAVFFSSDLYTTFVFFEIMSFTSYVWVAHEENPAALRAADTYLGVAVLGGLVMLMGIFGIYHELGTLKMDELLSAASAYENKAVLYALGGCLFFGFGAKAGAFPLHIWLPKAHPVAPAPASALLSGILTKTGIFGVLLTTCGLFLHDKSWGGFILVIGTITMFGGALLAVFSIDLKRTLACSSMSQIGFILIGVGMQCMLGEEGALAVHGTMLHMCNHSMIKLVLFLSAGVIYMNAHALDLNVIRGFGRHKPLLKVIFLCGALAIGGIPFFGGYVSKTLLHESILEYEGGAIFRALEYIFLLSGGMTVGYMTKLFVAIFVEENESSAVQKKYDEKKPYMNRMSTFAVSGSALVLFIWGFFPHQLMDKAAKLAEEFMALEESGHTVHYFSLSNLSGAAISICIGAVVYLVVIRRFLMRDGAYVNAWPAWLDLENLLYRRVLLKILPFLLGAACRVLELFLDTAVKIVIPLGHVFARIPDSLLDLTVVGLRKTVYKEEKLPYERAEGSAVSDLVGGIANVLQAIANKTWRRKNPTNIDYKAEMAIRRAVRAEGDRLISRSLSFGLIIAAIGFAATLIYIVFVIL